MGFNVLCIGDVVGRPGCLVLSEKLAELKERFALDCVIANVENAAGGSGLTPNLYAKIERYGVDLMSLGDHVYRKVDIIPVLEQSRSIVRPANFPPDAPGRQMAIWATQSGPRVALVSVMGRLFMKPQVDCPFRAVDRLLATLDKDVKIIVVEMHAEATSEKIGMGWHLDGKASVVFGTHTHVQTADERVLPNGTGYITDLGMTGPHEGILGRDKERVLSAMISAVPTPFHVCTDDVRLCGIVASIDPQTGRCLSIQRVVERLESVNQSPTDETA